MTYKKLAVFDFDDTLYKGQSINDFLEYLYNGNIGFTRKIVYKTCKQIVRFCNFSSHTNKLFLTLFIKNLSLQKLELCARLFNQDIIEKKLNPLLYDHLLFYLKSDYDVAIVSGGLEIYLRIFSNNKSIQYCIASQIISFRDRFKTLDKECLGEEKLRRILAGIPIEKYDIAESCIFTDHLSDLPLLEYFGRGFFVVKANSVLPSVIEKKKWNIIHIE